MVERKTVEKSAIVISNPTAKFGKILSADSEKESLGNESLHTHDNGIDNTLSSLKFKFICPCVNCKYRTDKKSHYDRHLKSPRHNKLINGEVTIKKYICEECSYTGYDKSNFNKHKLTHQRNGKLMGTMTRDNIYMQISKYKGKVKNIKNKIDREKNQSKKEDLENKLKEIVEITNMYVREFNRREEDNNKSKESKKIFVKGKKSNNSVTKEEQENIIPSKSKKSNKDPKSIAIKLIKESIQKFKDLDLDVNDYYDTEGYENQDIEELEKLQTDLHEDLTSDQTMIDYIKEQRNIGCAACKYYLNKYHKCCQDHD